MTIPEDNLYDCMILVVDIYRYNWMKHSKFWKEIETDQGFYLIPKNRTQENAVSDTFRTQTPIRVYSQGEILLSQISSI